ncbi:hypothetical protein EG68_06728 [Paragonimus skrjabini miyazakii]|uniref:Uncharacterized protein n=1 Tax=Paragonimus skrjabini miyazakii TaxID=59628 RepID=A0A8S9YU60_9TREM|nr:hypothetical protein EG68_06728 [Paragonimus skrjabini miyazakii]
MKLLIMFKFVSSSFKLFLVDMIHQIRFDPRPSAFHMMSVNSLISLSKNAPV